MNEINHARTLARIAHAGQKYGGVGDYFEEHIFKVATRVLNDPDTLDGHMTVAYLHDIVEDTTVTIEDLIALGFSPEVVDAVNALTRKPGQQYEDYIAAIVANPDGLAWLVKYHDLQENLANSRDARNGKQNLIERYENALEKMS